MSHQPTNCNANTLCHKKDITLQVILTCHIQPYTDTTNIFDARSKIWH